MMVWMYARIVALITLVASITFALLWIWIPSENRFGWTLLVTVCIAFISVLMWVFRAGEEDNL